nr:MAG TPA: hypothetical protein [Caudoviricetes sp.]
MRQGTFSGSFELIDSGIEILTFAYVDHRNKHAIFQKPIIIL